MNKQKELLVNLDSDFQVVRTLHLNITTGWFDKSKYNSNLVFAKDITAPHIQGRYRLNSNDNKLNIQEFFFDLEWTCFNEDGTEIKGLTKDIVNKRFQRLKRASMRLLFSVMKYVPKDYIYLRASGSGLHLIFFLKGLKSTEEWELITKYFIYKSRLSNTKNASKLVYGLDKDSTLSSERKIAEFGSWNKLKKDLKQEVDYLNYATYLSVDAFFKAKEYPFCSKLEDVKYPEEYRYFDVPKKLLDDALNCKYINEEISTIKKTKSGNAIISRKRNIIEFNEEIPKDDPAGIIKLTPYWNILRDSEAQWYARQFLVKYLRWGLNLNKKEIIELIDKYNAWSDYNPRITAYYVAKHFREGTAETKVRKPVRKATLKRYGII